MTDKKKGTAGPLELDRRELLKLGAAGVGFAALNACTPGGSAGSDQASMPRIQRPDLGSGPEALFASAPMDLVRIGMVGVGLQGTSHVRNFLGVEGCHIVAVCDLVPEHAERTANMVEEAGFPRPTMYTNGERDFERLCTEEELDLVFTATPWEWHVPVCLAAMENGKHAATEVPAAYTVDDCWALVESAERNQKHCAESIHGPSLSAPKSPAVRVCE